MVVISMARKRAEKVFGEGGYGDQEYIVSAKEGSFSPKRFSVTASSRKIATKKGINRIGKGSLKSVEKVTGSRKILLKKKKYFK